MEKTVRTKKDTEWQRLFGNDSSFFNETRAFVHHPAANQYFFV